MTAAAETEPRVPAEAAIPNGATAEERAGLRSMLDFFADYSAWAKEGWRRVEAGQGWCKNRPD